MQHIYADYAIVSRTNWGWGVSNYANYAIVSIVSIVAHHNYPNYVNYIYTLMTGGGYLTMLTMTPLV